MKPANSLIRTAEFAEWLRELRDLTAKARIVSRLDAAVLGHFGDCAPVGQGVIDMRGVVQALREVGYDGFLSFEYSGFEDFLGVARQSKEYMERILQEVEISRP